jgi:hypothetical protein
MRSLFFGRGSFAPGPVAAAPLLLAVLIAGGCTCGRDSDPAQKKTREYLQSPSRPRVGAIKHAALPPSVKPVMKRLQFATEQLRSRTIGHATMEKPVKMAIGLVQALPLFDRPGGGYWNDELAAKLHVLGGKQSLESYNAVVEICVKCHELHAPPKVGETRALLLQQREMLPPPEPVQKKGGLQ